jgi:hypothetical protein
MRKSLGAAPGSIAPQNGNRPHGFDRHPVCRASAIQFVSLKMLPYCHIANAIPAKHQSQNTISHLADGFPIDGSGIRISDIGYPPLGSNP